MSGDGETMCTLKKCKINFNEPLALTINNLLKPPTLQARNNTYTKKE